MQQAITIPTTQKRKKKMIVMMLYPVNAHLPSPYVSSAYFSTLPPIDIGAVVVDDAVIFVVAFAVAFVIVSLEPSADATPPIIAITITIAMSILLLNIFLMSSS